MSYTSPLLLNVDDYWLDVDLTAEAMKCSRKAGMLETFANAGEFDAGPIPASELIPEREVEYWIKKKDEEGTGLNHVLVEPQDQGQEGTCVHFGGAHLTQLTRNLQFGCENHVLGSPISSYVWCAPNGRRGSSVPGALDQLAKVGQIPADTPRNRELMAKGYFKHVWRQTGYSRNLPSGWEGSASILRVHEYRNINSIAAVWTMILKYRRALIEGHDGHCTCVFDVSMKDGKRVYTYIQSWGKWGFSLPIYKGQAQTFGLFSESKVTTGTTRGAWGVMSVVTPPWLVRA